ncbi:MAG: Tm-1-like ATP-binding domain-containing protein [Syntrophorhabdales bacterium]
MKKTVALVVSLDTKSEEAKLAKDLLEGQDLRVITMDVGTGFGGRPAFVPDYPAEELARAAGTTLSEILAMGWEPRGPMAPLGRMGAGASTFMGGMSAGMATFMGWMSAGASGVAARLYAEGKLHGIFSLGGTLGTHMATAVMRSLPLGIPKIMVSTAASGDVRSWVGTKDIVMISSTADIAGLNRITRNSLRKATGAMCGMMLMDEEPLSHKPLIAVTALSSSTEGAMRVKARLEEKGFEVVVFHAIGMGGRTMEELVLEGKIQGVFDMSTNEVLDHLYGGMADAGPDRLEGAGKMGLPYLVAPGNLDLFLYTSLENMPEQFKDRKVFRHGTHIYVIPSKKTEMEAVGAVIAEKLNKAKGPTAVIFPLKGFSFGSTHIDKEEFGDPEPKYLLLETLKKQLRPDIKIIECELHVNEEEFACRAADVYSELYAIGTARHRTHPSPVGRPARVDVAQL